MLVHLHQTIACIVLMNNVMHGILNVLLLLPLKQKDVKQRKKIVMNILDKEIVKRICLDNIVIGMMQNKNVKMRMMIIMDKLIVIREFMENYLIKIVKHSYLNAH